MGRMDVSRPDEAFFDCAFVWTPRELAGDEPYAVLVDDKSAPFTPDLIRTCRGAAGFQAVVTDPADVPAGAVAICDGPTWVRQHEAMTAAGVRGPRARVLLYFDVDPSGFWDFAEACGDRLGEIFHEGGATAQSAEAIAPFLEHWSGSRLVNQRLLPYARFYTRDFYPLHQENADKIVRILAAFADDESRAAYARILFGTAEQVVSHFSGSVFGAQQYMEIVEPQPGDVIVNCGVGRGWELPYFLARLQGAGEIHNIDPNMVYWSSHFADFIHRFPNIVKDHPIIVGDKDGQISLSLVDSGMIVSAGESSGEGSQTFDIRKLDSLVEEGVIPRIDYLKMDVEGGEKSILAGAVEAIRKHRPKLAVAIYHEPEHFWDYPAFILDNFPDYRLYLRQYGYSRFETLLYAVPAEAEDRSGTEGLTGIAPAPRRAGTQDLALFYAHDAPDAPRDFYVKPIRALTRHCGVDWQGADIAPGPYIDAETVAGAIETPAGNVILTSHRAEDGAMRATVGVAGRSSDVSWAHAVWMPDGGQCGPVDSADGKVRFYTWSPEPGLLDVYTLDGEAMSQDSSTKLRKAPILVRQDENGAAALIVGEGGQGVWAAADGGETPVDLPAGTPLGAVAVKRPYRADSPSAAGLGVLSPDGATLDVYVSADGDWSLAASFDWDSRLNLVPTLIASGTVAAPAREGWRDTVLQAAGAVGAEGLVRGLAARVRKLTGKSWR